MSVSKVRQAVLGLLRIHGASKVSARAETLSFRKGVGIASHGGAHPLSPCVCEGCVDRFLGRPLECPRYCANDVEELAAWRYGWAAADALLALRWHEATRWLEDVEDAT